MSPALKYKDPGDGQWKVVPVGVSSSGTGIPIYATPAARDAAIPSPIDGQTCWITSLVQQQTRIGGYWVPSGGTLPHADIKYGVNSISEAASGRLLAVPSNITAVGGITWNAGGKYALLPSYPGWYQITFYAVITSLTPTGVFYVGTGDTAAAQNYGTTLTATTAGRAAMSYTRKALASGEFWCPWYLATATNGNIQEALWQVRWIGS